MRTATCKLCGQTGLKYSYDPNGVKFLAERTRRYVNGDIARPNDPHFKYCPKAVQPSGNAALGQQTVTGTAGNQDRAVIDSEAIRTIVRTEVDKLQISIDEQKLRDIVTDQLFKSGAVTVEHKITFTDAQGRAQEMNVRPHKMFARLVRLVELKFHVMLVGPAGGGKTTAAHMVAEILRFRYFEESMGIATSQYDLVGYRSPDGKYVPGVLRDPYENGGITMFDEMDAASGEVHTKLNSMLSNGSYTFPDGARVAKHEDFRLIAGANTFGRGADRVYIRQQLDGAFLDRFAVLYWDYDEEAEIDWAGRDMIEWTKYVQRVRAVVFQHRLQVIVSPRASINGAIDLRNGGVRAEVEETHLWKGISEDNRSKIMSNLRS